MSSGKGPSGPVEKPADKEAPKSEGTPSAIPPAVSVTSIPSADAPDAPLSGMEPPVGMGLAGIVASPVVDAPLVVPLTGTAVGTPLAVPKLSGAMASVGSSPPVDTPLAASLGVAPGPLAPAKPDVKSPAMSSSGVSGGSAGALGSGPSASDLQALAKAQYATKYNLQLALGQGSFKRVLPFEAGLALAVSLEEGPKAKAMLEEECENLRFLRGAGFPAIGVASDVFQINAKGKFAVVMEAVPDHTFIDGKDPGTMTTLLPSILLDVKIPSGEAWIFKLPAIKAEIAKKIGNPGSLALAQEKAAKLYAQLEQIETLLKTPREDGKSITIVDLQLLVDRAGNIRIIDPLEILKYDSKENAYFKLTGEKIDTNENFTASIERAQGVLAQMKSYCRAVVRTKEPGQLRALVTPAIGPGASAIASASDAYDPEFAPAGGAGPSSRPRPVVFGPSALASLSAAGSAGKLPPRPPAKAGPSSKPPHPGVRPASMVFSAMPPSPPLPSGISGASAGVVKDASASAEAGPSVDAAVPDASVDASKIPDAKPAKKPGSASPH